MRALRLPLPGYDLALRGGAGLLTLFAAYVSVKMGAQIGFGLVLVIAFFAACVLGFLLAPHWTVALMIPTFEFIPAAKVLVTPKIGPLKDVVVLAAIIATLAVLVLEPSKERRRILPDRWVLTVGAFGLVIIILVMMCPAPPKNLQRRQARSVAAGAARPVEPSAGTTDADGRILDEKRDPFEVALEAPGICASHEVDDLSGLAMVIEGRPDELCQLRIGRALFFRLPVQRDHAQCALHS